MTELKKNIDHYMEKTNIENYVALLRKIGIELGKDQYSFIKSEKANFSKTLQGKRPLNREFIEPLEKIFGVSYARLINEDAYKLPVEKNEIILNKSLRYYAYKDDPGLYKNELSKLTDKEGNPVIKNTDEYGKSFLNYIVEYGSVNGVRYLYDTYEIRQSHITSMIDFEKAGRKMCMPFDNSMGLARLVASMNDAELFYGIFDSYHLFFTIGSYGRSRGFFGDGEFAEIILDNNILFEYLFEPREYEFKMNNRPKFKKDDH